MHPVLFRISVPGWNLPVLGKLGVIPIYSYGVMLGLSLVVGWYLTLRLCEKDGLDRERMANCYVFTALVALVGSRWMYLLTNPSDFHSLADLFSFRGGGLVAYGGFLGGFLGSFAFMRLKREPLLPWADAAVPSLAAGLAITRIGCYLFGCDYGRPLSGEAPSWLVRLGTFPRWADGLVPGSVLGPPALDEHVRRKLVDAGAAASAPVHPTQLYESLVGALLLVLLVRVRATRRFRGEVFCVATFVYGLLRFLLEFVRDDPERGGLPLSLPRHVLWPACLLAFAVAFGAAFAQRIPQLAARRVAQSAALLPALGAAIVLRPQAFAVPERASLSTSQVIGLGSAVVVAAAYWMQLRAHAVSTTGSSGDAATKPAEPAADDSTAEAEDGQDGAETHASDPG